jgi:FdhD protein
MADDKDFSNVATSDPGYGEVVIQRFKNSAFTGSTDLVAHEVPVALVFNGISHAVMLATPLNLIDFALGFSFSEGIIDHRSEVYDIEEFVHPDVGIEVHLNIATANFAKLKERRRTMVGRTGCGLCGLESLTAFEAGIETPALHAETNFVITQQALFGAFKSLQQKQSINKVTGSMHAAAWVSSVGEVLMVREDLGRHNALDKLIGALLDQDISTAHGCVIMTSRASYELAQKTARARIPLLATISAPTSLAIDLAQKSELTLIGFVRDTSLVVYSHPERIQAG